MTSVPGGRSLSSSWAMGASLAWPADNSICTGRPLPMTRAWSLLVNPPRLRPIQAPPACFLGSGLLMDAHAGRIDHLHLAIMGGDHRLHQAVPDAGFAPAVEAIVDRRRRPVAFRHVGPWCSRSQHPEDAVQHPTVIDPRHTAWLVRQQRLDHLPLEVRQIVARHRKAPFGTLNHFSRLLGIVYEYAT